jgi:DNA-binding transcriptional regulator YhcF (GntR family)
MDVRPIDPTSGTPPYEQLRSQIASRVASGDLAPGSRLPTVRALAAQVDLAVNTVARVYRELEADGVVVTEGRRGTFVASSEAGGSEVAVEAAASYAATTRRLGRTLAEATRLLEQSWAVEDRD